MDAGHIAALIDEFLKAEKTLAGTGRWQRASTTGEYRIAWPLLVSGEGSNFRLIAIYYLGT